MIYMTIVLIFICLLQAGYILNTDRQLREWFAGLREIHSNPCQKLFTRKKGIVSDITFELNDILSDTQKQLGQLRKTDEANRQMLTDLSHDVRTPLASLIGYLEALHDGAADRPEEYIAISYQKALALKDLTDMLFEWCKIASDEQQYHISLQDINELTRETIIEWIPFIEKEKIELEAELSEDEFPVPLDGVAYKRVVNNLIKNAVFHGRCSRIGICTKRSESGTSVCISNNGAPIPADKLPFIFDRLYKCDEARREAGSGLGLSIARELVLAMDGEIKVTSSAQETVFTINFPPQKLRSEM